MEPTIPIANQTPKPKKLGIIARNFPALLDRNFKLYFTGQLISMIGTWLQNVAQGWLVLELTHSAFWVGTTAASSLAPIFLFGLFGGVIVDRANRKKILLITQSASLVLAAILGILTIGGWITVPEIIALAFLLGMLNAIDIPARQAMLAEMVPKQYLTSAIALNSTTSNGSRIIGPAFAGALIAIVGTGYTFLLNAASYLAAIIAISLIRYEQKLNPNRPNPLRAIREGISYTFSHAVIRTCLFAMTSVALFGYSFNSILPAIVAQVFHGTSSTLGYLLAAAGIGSVVAGILISARATKWNEIRFAAVASSILAISFFAYAFTDELLVGLALSLLLGLTLTGTSSTLTTLVQHRVDEAIRGRVISVILISFTAAMAIGSFSMGYVAEHFGYRATLLGSAIGTAGVAIFLVVSYRRTKSAPEARALA